MGLRPDHILMRPHHLLCLPGYVGFGYSKEHANSWDMISHLVASNSKIKIKVVEGRDTLCFKCPSNEESNTNCNEAFIKNLDEKVKNLLNIENNQFYIYSELAEKLKKILNPQKHEELCGDCGWRTKFGLCIDTFKKNI